MPNAVEHNGKIYILNPEPRGDYAEKVGAPYLTQALRDFGIETIAPSYRPTTNETVARALVQGNPNLTGINFRTDYNNIELLEVRLPQGMSAADAVKALNNFDPKTSSYIDKGIADEFARKRNEALSEKSASNAIDITLASGISPHATVTEQLMVNADKFSKSEYIITQQGTSFTVESRLGGHKMTVTATVDPKFPDRVQLEMSANGYDESASKFKHAVASVLLDGILKDTKSSTVRDAVDFVSNKKILADITPDKAKQFAEARRESLKGLLIGQSSLDKMGIGGMTDQPEVIAPGVKEEPSRFSSVATGSDSLEDLIRRSGQNDPLSQQYAAADEILRARTLAKIDALREAGHIPQDVSAEEVLKKSSHGASFAQLKDAGLKVAEFKAEVRIAMDSIPEANGSIIDRMAEAERIAKQVIADRDFKKGITILQQSNPHLAAMSEAEIKLLVTRLQESGKPVDIDNFTEAAKKYRTYIETQAPASTGNVLNDLLNASDPAVKRAALDHAVDSGSRLGSPPVQPSSLLNEILNQHPTQQIRVNVDSEADRKPYVTTDSDRALIEEILKRGMVNQPQIAAQVASIEASQSAKPRPQDNAGASHSAGPTPPATTNTSFTAAPPLTQVSPSPAPSSAPVMSAATGSNSGTAHLVDQTAPAMGHAEVLGATALKPKLQEDLRPDIRETPSVGQVASPHSASANDPIHTPSRLAQAPTNAPLAGINTTAPAANAEPYVQSKPIAPASPSTPVSTSPNTRAEALVESSPSSAKPASGTTTSTMNKVGVATGRTQLGVVAGAQLAEGNVIGAASTVAEGVATNAAVSKASEEAAKLLAKQGLKSAGVFVGFGATIAFGISDVNSRVKNGNYGAAAIESVTLVAEAAGNLLPSGLAGAGLRETFRAAVVSTLGEKYAPEKSGIRKAAELGSAVAGNISRNSQFASMDEVALRKAIESDPTFPKTVIQGGKTIALVDAMKDDTFRKKFIDNLEKAATKGHDLSTQVAMIKAYNSILYERSTDPAIVAQRDAARDANFYNTTPII